MIHATLIPLAFNVGSTVLSRGSARAQLVSMAARPTLEGDFVYGAPVPASQGIPGFCGPKSFTDDMTGVVVPTASARAPISNKATVEGDFVYGAPVPASQGVPGFSRPTQFTLEKTAATEATDAPAETPAETGTAAPRASARPPTWNSAVLEGNFVYGAPVPASKGVPGFSSPTQFTADKTGAVTPTGGVRPPSWNSANLEGNFVYGPPKPASQGVPGFTGPKAFLIESESPAAIAPAAAPAAEPAAAPAAEAAEPAAEPADEPADEKKAKNGKKPKKA